MHRFLEHQGIQNIVVDSSSIEVKRRGRRRKTDSLDAGKLVSMLVRWQQGERNVWSVVQVPTVADEDRRQLHRDLLELKAQRTQHTNRIKGLLAACGLAVKIDADFPEVLARERVRVGLRNARKEWCLRNNSSPAWERVPGSPGAWWGDVGPEPILGFLHQGGRHRIAFGIARDWHLSIAGKPMRCHCCSRDVPLGRKVQLRPFVDLVFFTELPDSFAYHSYVET